MANRAPATLLIAAPGKKTQTGGVHCLPDGVILKKVHQIHARFSCESGPHHAELTAILRNQRPLGSRARLSPPSWPVCLGLALAGLGGACADDAPPPPAPEAAAPSAPATAGEAAAENVAAALNPPQAAPAPVAAPKTPPTGPAAAQAAPEAEADEGGPRFVRAEIKGPLEPAIVEVTNPQVGAALSQVAARVLLWWVDLRRDLRPGDVLELVYSERPDEEPRIHAIWFFSQKKGRGYSAVHTKLSGQRFARWYDPSGYEVARRLKRPPIADYEQITARLGDGRRHKGTDFKAPVGTPVLATFTGVIRRRNWHRRSNGRCLDLVDKKHGRRAMYLHLDSVEVRPGQRVRVGQRIGRSGNTGRSYAPHLHYQLETLGGRVLDALKAHPTERRRVKRSELLKIRRAMDRYESLRKTAA